MGIEQSGAPTSFDDPKILRALAHEAPMGLVGLDTSGAVVAWNPGAERIFGLTEAEAKGKTIRDLLGPTTTVDPDALVAELDTKSPVTFTAPGVQKGGALLTCEWRLCALRGDDGEIVGRVAFVRDTTEEATKHTALAHQRDLLRRVLDNTPLVLWSSDEKGVFTMSEGSGLAALGLEPGQVVGMNVFDVYAGVPDIVRAIRGALVGAFSVTLAEAGGRWWEGRYIPLIRDEGGAVEGVLGLAIDVSDRVDAERALRQKLDLIEQQESAIRTLSTPIVRVWEEVLALPLVGTIDGARAERILATLLDAVVAEQAQYVIMDMTGIGSVDGSTADHLFKVLRALGLLGATAIVTGIKPGVATALVDLGVDLSSVVTLGNLEEAIRFVMKRRAEKPRRAPANAGKRA
jgi:rsbT co-antagonist protein RsbR